MTREKKVRFKALPLDSPNLFPENLFDRIGEKHPVRLVDQVVDQLNIDSILNDYKGGGTSSYHPKMLLKVLFYAYLSNIYSCRKIAKALEENIHFIWLSGNSKPDFRTINHFRSFRLKGKIQKLFAELVRLLHGLGYLSLKLQYIDGTKIESSANRYSFVWKGSVEKYKEKLDHKIHSVLREIETHIKADKKDLNREELGKEIDSRELSGKIEELNRRLSEESKEEAKTVKKKFEKLEKDYLPRLKKYEKQLKLLGERKSYSKTDTDATFMRLKDDHMKNGQLKAAYNVQISTENQFISHYSLHQCSTDTTTVEKHLEGFKGQYKVQSKEVVADAGYGSEENYEWMKKEGIKAYVKYNYFHQEEKPKHKNNPFLSGNLFYNKEKDFLVCPMGQRMERVGEGKRISANNYVSQVSYYKAKNCRGCPLRSLCHKGKAERIIEINHRLNELREEAKTLLNSDEGKRHRSKRPVEVEAVFGQLKSNNKFNRFTLRGLEKTNIEFGLMAIGHNLRKMAARLFFDLKRALFCQDSENLLRNLC